MNPLPVYTEEISDLGEGPAILLAYLRTVQETEEMASDDMSSYSAREIAENYTPEEVMSSLYFRQTGWFPASYHDTQEGIGMSFTRQTKYLKQLIKAGVIEMSCSGRPARRLFRFLDKRKNKRNKK